MKKAYTKPEAKKISFQYTKVVAASGQQYCDQGWTKATVLIPWDGTCAKCYDEFIWIGSTAP
ncbi:MAG: hypothetical protein MR400_07090 [Clostridiales bacterium]|nr:hypothetical protein [Clostridiales bacterium]